MQSSLRAIAPGLLLAAGLFGADAGVTLIGVGEIPGSALDLSGLTGQICQRDDAANCIPRATFGGFGSALAYTGHDNVFLAVPDRGPFDGRTTPGNPYINRFHFLQIVTNVGAAFPNIQVKLLDTRFLRNGNLPLIGDAYSFNNPDWLRFDAEGVRVSPNRTFYVSDEYGPYIFEFDRDGYLIRRLPVPAKFLITNPSGDVDSAGNSLEIYPDKNTYGRQANRGMEGLAITPDGRYLVGIMQNALIQDNGLNTATPPGRVGVNNRILKMNVDTGNTQEFVYVMDAVNQGRGVNEMLAINDHEFLVLERDNRTYVPTPPGTPAEPLLKRLYKIDLAKQGLTDVSAMSTLPATAAALAAAGVTPVDKTLFLDLLDSSYKVDATHTVKDVIAEKIEGLAWGPDLPDGRHVLYVISDNDLSLDLPTKVYAFAIDAAKINFQPQTLPRRIYPKYLLDLALASSN
ncbi:MAG: esterase-like activity of phytase family protein [Acidobacteria bacterium]|nr:esterase-like activity of phytase family protein [Acidobacteriota bacterium]